jgi:hypothetical protein
MKPKGLLITTQSIVCVCMVRMYNYICPRLGLTSNSLHGPFHAWMTSPSLHSIMFDMTNDEGCILPWFCRK